MKKILILIFCCVSCYAFSQSKKQLKTITKLEFELQSMFNKGYHEDDDFFMDYYFLALELCAEYSKYNQFEKTINLVDDLLLNLEIDFYTTFKMQLLVAKARALSYSDFEESKILFREVIASYNAYFDNPEEYIKSISEGDFTLSDDEKELLDDEFRTWLDITLSNLSVLYMKKGDYASSLEYQFMVANKDYIFYNNIAKNYELLGDDSNAKKYYLISLDLMKQNKYASIKNQVTLLNNLSLIFNKSKDIENALLYHNKAIELCKREYDVNHSLYAWCLLYKTQLLDKKKDYLEIASLQLEIERIFYNIYGFYSAEYLSSVKLGLEHCIYNNHDITLCGDKELLQSFLQAFKQFYGVNSETYIDFLNSLAFYYFLQDDLINERRYINEYMTLSLELYKVYENKMNETLRTQALDQALSSCRIVQMSNIKSQSKGIYISSKELISTFNYLSYLKGKELTNSRMLSFAAYNSEDQKVISMYEELSRINNNISICFELNNSEIKAKGWNIQELQNKADNLERQLSTSLSLNLIRAKDNLFDDITSLLEDNEAYLDILVSTNQEGVSTYYAYIIKKDDTIPQLFGLYSESILDSIYRYYSNYTQKRPSRNEFSHVDEHYGNICYNNFWSKLVPYLEGVSTVYFSPEGVYSKINPNVLYDSTSSSFLMDKYEIVYVSNVEDFVHQKENIQLYDRPDDLHAVLVGNPTFLLGEDEVVFASNTNQSRAINQDELDSLQRGASLSQLPATQTEIDLISRNLKSKGWDVEVISGVDATETRVKSIEAPKILHIATHGFFFEDQEMIKRSNMISTDNKKAVANPMTRSGLIFSGAENTINGEILANDNGWLNSYEASLLNLRGTELVVLSACETGSGDVQNGKGVYGLQRAITVAGAESLIMSMWEVDDKATQELMTYFYDYWIDKKMTKKEAFKKAQQKIREKYKHPYYWGAFIMLGE